MRSLDYPTNFNLNVHWTDSCDISAVFDGGSRKVRRELEDLVDEKTWMHSAELTLVFKPPQRSVIDETQSEEDNLVE